MFLPGVVNLLIAFVIVSCGAAGEIFDASEGKDKPDFYDLQDVRDIQENGEDFTDLLETFDVGDEDVSYFEYGHSEEEGYSLEAEEEEFLDGDEGGEELFIPCYNDDDCEDGDPCTIDRCNPQTGECSVENKVCLPVQGCFMPACGKEGYCFHTPELNEKCYEEIHFSDDFEGGDFSGWLVEDLVKNVPEGEAPVVWNLHTKRSLSGKQSAYFGIKGKSNYDNGKVVASSLTSPIIKADSDSRISLVFWAYLDCEEGEYWDILTVNIITGGKQIPVWAKKYGMPLKEWFFTEIDLTAFRGTELRVSFTFNSVDDSYNNTEGIYIDNIYLLATGKSVASCTDDFGCADSLACTAELCQDGLCVYEMAENCCTTDAECDDFDVCTINICNYGQCLSYKTADPFCCNKDAECDDNNDCTEDSCKNNKCSYAVLPVFGCCTKDSDCNDNDKCTLDQCVANKCKFSNLCCYSDEECDDGDDVCTVDLCKNNKCVYMPTGGAGCCVPVVAVFNFDDGTSGGFEIANKQSEVGWQVVTGKKCTSPYGALYYGNPAKGNFDSGGANSGTATSPPIMPKLGFPYELSMQLYMDNEFSMVYDKLEIYIIAEDKPATLVWDKSKPFNMFQFKKITMDISAWAGSTIQIMISFDTVDSISNDGEGVYIDDITVTTPCIAKMCETNADCNDNIPATKDLCSGGTCTYQW